MESPITESASLLSRWIVQENSEIILLNKPAGEHCVEGKSAQKSIATRLVEVYPALESVGKRPGEAGLLQRLDYWTSGVLLAAKTSEAWNKWWSAIHAEDSQKTYLCLVEGEIKQSVSIENFIGAKSRDANRVWCSSTERPRYLLARTDFEPVRFDSKKNISLVRATLARGRRHQVRAHAAALGHPLLGDSIYGSKVQNADERFYLHAASIAVQAGGRCVSFEVPPADWAD